MIKGFIFFKDGKIPFVIENYRMELFTDDPLLEDFWKEYNIIEPTESLESAVKKLKKK